MSQYFVDPYILGLILLAFFVGYVLLQNTRMDAKVVILAPVCVLAMLFIPSLIWFLLAMFGVFILYKVLKRENQ
jgi:predicted branched-subunit amino acid permease